MGFHTRLEFDDYVSPDGLVYAFHDGVTRFLMGGIGGLGMAPINYRTERGPNQDGVTVIGRNLGPRLIQMVHRRRGKDRDDFWRLRADLINHLRPNRQLEEGDLEPGKLRKHLPDGRTLCLDVYVEESPQFRDINNDQWDENSFTEAIRFIAMSPTLYDEDDVNIIFSGANPVNQLIFPITFPITFGLIGFVNKGSSVTYAGTYKTYPIITLRGPLSNPLIENLTTGQKIRLIHTIGLTESVTIDLTGETKTVFDNTGASLTSSVTTDSDLADFHIAAAPEAVGGVNTLQLTGYNADPQTLVSINYLIKYIGI